MQTEHEIRDYRGHRKYLIKNYASHRNGVGGDFFECVWFTLTEDGQSTDLIAVISADERERATRDEWEQWRCYVIDPTDPENKWRGDNIGADLVALGIFDMIDKAADDKWQAFLAGR